MAIVVRHKVSGARFVVLGANLAKWKTARSHALFGNLAPVEQEGADRVLVVCGADGAIQFADADAFTVVAIDGKAPQQAIEPG